VESHKFSLMELCVFDGLEKVIALNAEEKLGKYQVISELEKVTLMAAKV